MNIFSGFLFNKSKYYGHVLSLGFNCEVSYQFFRHYHFVESGLFSWMGLEGVRSLINSLQHFDDIASQGFTHQGTMYQCNNSGILFHGRLTNKECEGLSEEEIVRKDTEELQSRLTHLKEKFWKAATDGKKNLYIYKHSPLDAEDMDGFIKEINLLYETLKNLITNEFDLLIVIEKKFLPECKENMFSSEHIFLRRVNYFNPPQCVTRKPNDRKSWKKIYKEFRPDFKLTKTKKYKFEQL